ncbi:Phosphate transporter PHO1-like protein 1-like [Oopsacas minuta]|uniref:Phosphate transporter PHO1-like protein 1-like n=1 Tax=Oopsacas minuta TaxID=111878 RepID=A0AAV7K8S7_9METZ|nr:Phosphate transporter PHO1-like protein 1-like [Oopsacas minuta]
MAEITVADQLISNPTQYGLKVKMPDINMDHIHIREERLYDRLADIQGSSKLTDDNALTTLKYTAPGKSEIERVFDVCDSEFERLSLLCDEMLTNIEGNLQVLNSKIDITANGYVEIEQLTIFKNQFTSTQLDFCEEFKNFKVICLKLRDKLTEISSIHNDNIDKLMTFLNFYQEKRKTNQIFLSIKLSEDEEANLCSTFIKQSKYFKQPQTSLLISTTDSLIAKIALEIQRCPTCEEHNPSVQKHTRAYFLLDIGCSVLFLITSLLFISFTFLKGYETSKWIVAFRLFRGPVFILAFIYLIVINIIVWTKSGVEYVKIFDFGRPGKVPTLRFMLNVCNVFSVCLFVVAIFYTFCVQFSWDFYFIKGLAMVLWGLYLAFMLNPVFIWSKSTRFAFARVLLRIITSPAHTVYFGDFWFADQLNSLVVILLDFQYFFCYCFFEFSTPLNSTTCSSHTSFIRPLIACLPAMWRLLQCLRNFWDTNDIWHFWNGIKYVTTFPVVILAAL